jgi:rhodanese-related sulfurtransferase
MRTEELANICDRTYPNTPRLSMNEFLHRSEREEWIIVDVRSPRERAVSVIPGSMSKEEFEARLEEAREKHILVYCTAGCRSGAYAQKLRKRGLDAFNLRGGVLAWALGGGTFVAPDGQPTDHVHVYGRRWNSLPSGYVPVR